MPSDRTPYAPEIVKLLFRPESAQKSFDKVFLLIQTFHMANDSGLKNFQSLHQKILVPKNSLSDCHLFQ